MQLSTLFSVKQGKTETCFSCFFLASPDEHVRVKQIVFSYECVRKLKITWHRMYMFHASVTIFYLALTKCKCHTYFSARKERTLWNSFVVKNRNYGARSSILLVKQSRDFIHKFSVPHVYFSNDLIGVWCESVVCKYGIKLILMLGIRSVARVRIPPKFRFLWKSCITFDVIIHISTVDLRKKSSGPPPKRNSEYAPATNPYI